MNTPTALPGSPTEQHQCQHCGIYWNRPRTRGQRPKWCPDCRTRPNGGRRVGRCACGATTADPRNPQCRTCYNAACKPAPEQLALYFPPDKRGPLRRAIESNDFDGVIAAIRARCTITPSGCWLWNGALKDGYPALSIQGRWFAVHRIALQAKHRRPLGSQPAHHTCGVTRCTAPEHLVPVTHAENAAEMLARHAYANRIAELEAALAALDPTHPLLWTIPTAKHPTPDDPTPPPTAHPVA